MRKKILLLVSLFITLTLTSCITSVYAQEDDAYTSNVGPSVGIIIKNGIPYYDSYGSIVYYMYCGEYYYPYYYRNRYYMYKYRNSLPPNKMYSLHRYRPIPKSYRIENHNHHYRTVRSSLHNNSNQRAHIKHNNSQRFSTRQTHPRNHNRR